MALAVQASAVEVIDDATVRANGRVYRLYHVDVPTPGHEAYCGLERARAADTANFIRDLLAHASVVQLRPGYNPRGRQTWPHDLSNTPLARITIDGQDLATILFAERRAVPWQRTDAHDWCARQP